MNTHNPANEDLPLRHVSEAPNVGIVMPDGCRLSARIWKPIDANKHPVPAIIEHLPYRKRDGTTYRDELTHPYFAERGYACIRVDMRGNGESEGLMLDEYTTEELQDACDVIAWARQQTWCDGNVGMMGISWGGFNSLQVAALQPPGLKAIITVCSTVDRFADDIHYKGGCLLTENIGWAANMLSYSSRPPDPMLIGDNWYALWLQRLENMPFLASTWLRHQTRDAYWRHGSICEDYSAINAAVLSVGGWHDGYRNTISHLVTNLSAPVKGIVGPWIHKYPHYAEPQPAIGFLQESLRWWDRWLKNRDTGVENDPAYRAWVMDSIKPERWHPARPGKWVGEENWPSDNVKPQKWNLLGDNHRAMLVKQQTHCNLHISTAQHCGSTTGEYFPFTFGPELPDNQQADDALSVCVDSEPLAEDITVLGAAELKLTVSSNKRNAFIAVRLCDLRPDGTSALITHGILNLAHHLSFEEPGEIPIDTNLSATIVLDQAGYRMPRGHRLRLALSTSYWPFVWPSPEQSELHVTNGVLSLPTKVKYDAKSVNFPPVATAEKWRTEDRRAASSTREVMFDDVTGEHITAIHNDFGEVKDLNHGLVSGGLVTEQWRIKPTDPLSARGEIHWVQTGGRDDWQWQSDAIMQITCTATHFHIESTLSVYNNSELIFEKAFTDRIAREYL